MVLSTTTPPEPVLRWAADQMSMGATLIAVQGLKDGAHPWLLRVRQAGKITQVVLRLGDPDHPEWLATEAAALALAKDRNLAAPRGSGTWRGPSSAPVGTTRRSARVRSCVVTAIPPLWPVAATA